MIVEERIGDLFTYPGNVIGHGVNTEGVMGAGIAAQFRRRWPQMFNIYRTKCLSDELIPGEMFAWEWDHGWQYFDSLWIVNLATQDYPGPYARLQWVTASILKAAFVMPTFTGGRREMAIPRIGCGIGGLDWRDVKRAIEDLPVDFTVVVYSLE